MAAPGTPVFEAVESPPGSLTKQKKGSSPAKQMAGSVATELVTERLGNDRSQALNHDGGHYNVLWGGNDLVIDENFCYYDDDVRNVTRVSSVR